MVDHSSGENVKCGLQPTPSGPISAHLMRPPCIMRLLLLRLEAFISSWPSSPPPPPPSLLAATGSEAGGGVALRVAETPPLVDLALLCRQQVYTDQSVPKAVYRQHKSAVGACYEWQAAPLRPQ